MLRNPSELDEAFSAAFPEIPEAELGAAHERFRGYVRLAAEVAHAAPRADLTAAEPRGTVSAGQVDPIRTFTNTG
jgi:hypothetical protein